MMTTIPGLIPGTKFSLRVQKPKVLSLVGYVDSVGGLATRASLLKISQVSLSPPHL